MRRFLFTGACLFLLSCSISAQSKLNGPSSKTKKLEEKISILGREYSRMIQRNDRAAIERTLSDDYLLADEEGKVFTKSEDLATYTEERGKTLKIEKIEYLDQKVRLIRDDVAIDHSTIRFTGMKKRETICGYGTLHDDLGFSKWSMADSFRPFFLCKTIKSPTATDIEA